MMVSRFKTLLFLAVAVPAVLLAAEPVKSKPDPRAVKEMVKEGVSRGIALFWKGDLDQARKEFQGVLKISPEEPDAIRFMGKIDDQFERIARKLLVTARKARLAADKDIAQFLDAQPNTPEGMKTMMQVLDDTAKKEEVPLGDLDWFMARPSTAPFTGERAEKQSKLKAHLKGAEKPSKPKAPAKGADSRRNSGGR